MDATELPGPVGWDDPLTGLDGPDFWQRILVSEIVRAHRYSRPLTVVVVELLELEKLHATWGGEVVREAVRAAAQCLKRTSRTSDYCCRLGPTRFGVVLTETDEIAAINVVERLRAKADRDVGARLSQGRVCFGWASPKGKTTLLESIGGAEALLAQEAGEAG